MREIALLVVDEPELAAACTEAILGGDPDVEHLRARIGVAVGKRLATALKIGPNRSIPHLSDVCPGDYTGRLVARSRFENQGC